MSFWNFGNAEGKVCAALVAVLLSWMWVIYPVRWWRWRRLPPGPGMGLPVLGHMHLLGILPHRSLHDLSQKYGPIIYLRLGSRPTIVLSSPSLAKQFLQDHDEAFAHRPAMEFAKLVFYNSQGSALM
eukprot:c13917_g1_i1 orf=69-449(+)